MKFHIPLYNHNAYGRLTIIDHAEFVAPALRALGHEVTVGIDPDISAMNIIWECFYPRSSVVPLKMGIKFGLVLTEPLDADDGFGEGRTNPIWTERYEAMKEAIPLAKFLWRLVPDALGRFALLSGELGGPMPRELRYGWVPEIATAANYGAPGYIYFQGAPTEYRAELLERLGGTPGVRLVARQGFLPIPDMLKMIDGASSLLGLKQHANWIWPSNLRALRALHAGRTFILEDQPGNIWPTQFFPRKPADMDVVDWIRSQDGFDQSVTREMLSATLPPMAKTLEHLIALSINDKDI